jgi:hypothetical protein
MAGTVTAGSAAGLASREPLLPAEAVPASPAQPRDRLQVRGTAPVPVPWERRLGRRRGRSERRRLGAGAD